MKKIFISFVAIAAIFSSCSNSDDVQPTAGAVGELKGVITFANDPGLKVAGSTAIPTTDWSNVTQVQMFLYYKTGSTDAGKVAFSQIIHPTAANQNFTWSNIPVGDYDLLLVANMKSDVNSIATSLDGGSTSTLWTDYNVRGKVLNTAIYGDLKSASFPTFFSGTGKTAYAEPSEIFTAYASNVVISETAPKILGSAALQLKREVGMMRIRVDRSGHAAASTNPGLAAELAKLSFADANTSIMVYRQPVGFGFKLGTFDGGIFAGVPSDENRVLVAASGASTFKTSDPASGYYVPGGGTPTILGGDFTLWRDILVLPNAAKADANHSTPSGLAVSSRKYFVVISTLAPIGYKLDNGTTISGTSKTIYWQGTVHEVFIENKIREVNLTLKSSGSPDEPNVTHEGGLDITVGAPEDWNVVIESSEIDV